MRAGRSQEKQRFQMQSKDTVPGTLVQQVQGIMCLDSQDSQNSSSLISLALNCDQQDPYSFQPSQFPRYSIPDLLLPSTQPLQAAGRLTPPLIPAILVITCVQVLCCYCLGFSISFIFSGIHGLHNPVPVMTEHLPSFMCLFGTVVVIPHYTVHG